MPTVSIIIPAYNAESTLGACIEACLKQSRPDQLDATLEILVVDDGSTDGTAAIAQRYPGVRYIRQENAGPAAARNCGAKAAIGDILAFTDSDCVPRSDWVERLLRGFEEGVGGVGGTYDIENPAYRLARLVHYEIQARHAAFGREVDFLGSFNVAYARAAFEAVGGFNEAFREASGEDNELAYRLHDQGWKLHFQPDAIVGHVHPSRLFSYLRAQKKHGYWRVRLYQLHPNRATGDRYAGKMDLWTPAMLVLLLALLPLTLLGWCSGWYVVACAMAYAGLRATLVWKLLRQIRHAEVVWFWPLGILRDGARAAGLLHGIWAFRRCRKPQK